MYVFINASFDKVKYAWISNYRMRVMQTLQSFPLKYTILL